MERLEHRAPSASQHSKQPGQGCIARQYVAQVSRGYFLVLQVVNEAPRPIGGNHPTSDSNLNQYFDSKVGLVDSASSTHGRHLTGDTHSFAASGVLACVLSCGPDSCGPDWQLLTVSLHACFLMLACPCMCQLHVPARSSCC